MAKWENETLVATVTVDAQGRVIAKEILKAVPGVDGKALIETSFFKPATLDGRPVATSYTLAIHLTKATEPGHQRVNP
jgi:hypothetical protein